MALVSCWSLRVMAVWFWKAEAAALLELVTCAYSSEAVAAAAEVATGSGGDGAVLFAVPAVVDGVCDVEDEDGALVKMSCGETACVAEDVVEVKNEGGGK